jgi:hypothetical protein
VNVSAVPLTLQSVLSSSFRLFFFSGFRDTKETRRKRDNSADNVSGNRALSMRIFLVFLSS